MSCYHPVTVWRSREINQGSGKRPLVFSAAKGQLGSQMQIPCNQCIGCRLDRARSWSIRLMHERTQHELCCFLTLTYNDHYLPKDRSLVKRDFQLFMKRLRKYHHYNNPDAPLIKYYMCGEYGGNTDRPHYHAIVFGLDFADKKRHSESKKGHTLYRSDKLNELWGLGHCWIGNVTHQSAGYVARYCLKKVTGDAAIDHYKRVNTQTGEIFQVLPEYMAASQGLGLSHFEEHHAQMYLRDSVIVNGKEAPVPKYYDRKMEALNPELMAQIKERRKQKALLRKEDNTYERLRIREEIKLAQTSLLKRELHD